jgi:hypothetical protein
MMVPNWSHHADVIGIPNRGSWGLPLIGGHPENTMAAAKAALAANYRIIEVDVQLSGHGTGANPRDIVAGKYFSMAAVGGPANKTPEDYSPQALVTFNMRNRDQSKSFVPEDRLILFKDLLAWAAKNEVLLVVEPRESPYIHEYYPGAIAAVVLEDAKAMGALSNIAMKSRDSYANTVKNIELYLQDDFQKDYKGRFLWVPVTNDTSDKEEQLTLFDIREWDAATENSKRILAYQIGLYSEHAWSGSHFYEDGKSYYNLIDYIKELTPLGKRSAVTPQEAMGDRGQLDAQYKWKFIANSVIDTRGSPFRNLEYPLSRHLAFISDRPQWYVDLVDSLYAGGTTASKKP